MFYYSKILSIIFKELQKLMVIFILTNNIKLINVIIINGQQSTWQQSVLKFSSCSILTFIIKSTKFNYFSIEEFWFDFKIYKIQI